MTSAEPVYLLDVNVLIALSWPQHVHHDRAHAWFATVAGRAWATTPITELAFVRLSSMPAVVHRRVTPVDALVALEVMRTLPGHTFLPDDTSLAEPVVSLARLASTRQVTDVHLANLAARHGATLTTFDRALTTYLDPADRVHVLLAG